VVEEFYNIFGPELKAVTGDPRHIEDVLKRVDALVKPIEEVSRHFCSTQCFLQFYKPPDLVYYETKNFIIIQWFGAIAWTIEKTSGMLLLLKG